MVKRVGYWVFGKDMNNVKLETLQKNGVTDIFLNYYAFTAHGKSKVVAWIKKAKKYNIKTHIWVQCFYDGDWVNPVNMDLNKKRKEIKGYANTEGVYGIHLDYLRYPGNAYKTSNGTATITKFVQDVKKDNPKVFLTCAVMPEEDCKKYYGQDITALAKVVNRIIPMQYKGNYELGTSWLKSTTKYFSGKGKIWSGLQSYKSDDDTTVLSTTELLNDVKTCFNNGAEGVVIFRYGLSHFINVKSYTEVKKTTTTTKTSNTKKTTTQTVTGSHSYATIVKKAKTIVNSAEKEHKSVGNKWSYYIAKAIQNPNKSIKKVALDNAPKPMGDSFANVTIKKADYVKCAKQLTTFVEKNHRLRNYLDFGKKRIRVRDYNYILAKVLVDYDKNKKLPSSSKVNTDVWKKPEPLHDYLTSEGCSGMGQCNGYYCACNSLQQMFYRLTGIKVSESTIAGWAGTTSSGTDHPGINTAVTQFNRKYNKNVVIEWYNFSDLGSNESARWTKISNFIKKGAVFFHLLYRNQWGHYEPIKSVGDYLKILNSLGDSCGDGTYCGYIESRSKGEQIDYINGISQKSVAFLYNK